MAVKLENCTKEEQRSVIGFMWEEGVPGSQIHQHMCAQYGDNALSRRVVYEWIEMFKNGCMSAPMQSAQAIQPQPQPQRMKKGLFLRPT
jgi:hypothetical protein